MKMVMLLYLDDDASCVDRLLRSLPAPAFSRFPIEGVGARQGTGWYGESASFHSHMAFAIVEDAAATEILTAVETCRDVEHAGHPIRAFQLNVEQAAACLCARGPEREK